MPHRSRAIFTIKVFGLYCLIQGLAYLSIVIGTVTASFGSSGQAGIGMLWQATLHPFCLLLFAYFLLFHPVAFS